MGRNLYAKLLVTGLTFYTLFQGVSAQTGFSVSLQTGYKFPFTRSALNPVHGGGFFYHGHAEPAPGILGSYGSGSYVGLSGLYTFRKNMECGLQFSGSLFPAMYTKSGDSSLFHEITYKANTIGLTPFIRLNKSFPAFTAYIQFGVPLYAAEINIEEQVYRSGSYLIYSHQYYPRQWGYGIMFGAGVKKTINRLLQINLDAQAAGIELKPRTGYFTDGSPASSRTTVKHELNTKEMLEENGQATRLPLSNLCISLGLIWTIN